MATLLVTVLFLTSSLMSSSEAGRNGGRRTSGGLPIIKNVADTEGATVVYWGQGGKKQEGTLFETCDSFERGDMVLISGLSKFGFGREPTLDLSDHCDPNDYFFGCNSLSRDIRDCQRRGLKVFLSIGGSYDGKNNVYGLETEEDAYELADFLWNHYLGGYSFRRPFGNAVLDGIDLDIQGGGDEYWDTLAEMLSEYSTRGRPVLFSGAVQCTLPDPYLDDLVSSGKLSYTWVKFYNDESCEYSQGNEDKLFSAWNGWSSHKGVKKLFLGIPEREGEPGFIPPTVLVDDILPVVTKGIKFGGILVWDRKREFLFKKRNNSSTIIV